MTAPVQPTIISFYTPTWEYEQHAIRLIAECEELGLPYHIKKLEPLGTWMDNTRLKSKFIYDTMNELDCPILWIDVDGSIYKQPSFLNNVTEDFIGRHQRTGPKRMWHVGTMFFNNTENCKKMINEWYELCKIGTGTDEAAFEVIWQTMADQLTFKELPEEYFEILAWNKLPSANAVIAHRLSTDPSKMELKRRNAIK